ncbi:MAG: ATP-binding protein [Gammaproteobacteria bacterium]|nr:ATP-binding protein [Gammaproteobacteria bacterium]
MTNTHATSSELTGGAGFTYEDTVVAYYLTALLLEEGAAGQTGVVTRVAVQQAPAFPLDDLVVQFRHRGVERTLSLQIRRKVIVSGAERNDSFRGILRAAAKTRAAPGFVKGTDAYGFVVEYAAERRLRDLNRLIELAGTSPDGAGFERHFAIAGPASQTLRKLRAELSASMKADSPEEERQFYRHFVAIRMDGLVGHGPLFVELSNRLRELVHPAADGVALLDALRTIAREGAGAAQCWTRESLIRQLRDRVALKVAPSYASDMSRLVAFSKPAMADISDEVAGVHVDRPRVLDDVRQQLARHRLVNLSGLPGSGKSAALKRAAESLAKGGPLLFLKHDRIESRSWGAFAAVLGLEHNDPVQILAEMANSGTPTLFIDGIDRIDPAHKGVVLDLVHAIESSEHLDHWTVLASSRDQGLECYRTWFPESFYHEAGIGDVTVPPFDMDEAMRLAQALPALSPLLLGSGNAAEVARRPFFADVMARSGPTREAAPQTEIDLVAAWWRGGGYEASQASVVRRQRALLDVAVQGLRTLGRRVPARQLREATLNEVAGLVADGVLQSIDDGGWFSFAHDIFFEWVFFRRLVELEGDWTDELTRTGEPPLLGRVVGLLAQKALEVSGGWSAGYRRLEAQNLRPQWRREWLTAPPLSSAYADRQAEFAGFLLEDEHRLLGKFLLWFQAHHTTPNAQILVSAALSGEAERIRFADLLGWPSDIAAWARMLAWLIPAAPTLPKRFAPAVVQVFSVWQNAFARSANPQSAAIVDLCSRWLVELEDVLYSPPEGPLHKTDWSDLGPGSQDLTTNLRIIVARSAPTYSGPLRELYERAKRSAHTRRSTYAELMALASTAAEVCPEALAAVTRAELMEELPGDRLERRRQEQREVYAYVRRIREKPEDERTSEERRVLSFPRPLPSEDRVDPDDVGIKRFEHYYSPPSPVHNPFAALFGNAPETGVTLVRDLANHAVQGWRQNEELRGADTPIPVTLSFPWGEQVFWGDSRHYDWFTIHASPEPLECAFLALRYWAFKELDRGRPVDEIIRAVVERNTCYGVLGLALAIALETLHVSKTVLPIVT